MNAIGSMVLFLYRLPPGELPPPPSACFGRDKLIKEIVALAESLTPIALVGTGGIGKTSIALRVLHHNHIKKQFGINRWFIRCDQFPASHTHFLSQLSKVIGAGVENPEDLTPLRPFLSSREMIIVLDNAESILDPQGSCVQKIYPLVEELSQFETICLCITSRISTVPRHCKRLVIPTLSMESACDIFYSIHNSYGKSNVVNNILRELDFHALSITLLATTASHNMWDCNRLAQEWNTHHVQVLQTTHNESLAATIELSLVSPTFHKLGPKARELLGVIAFFPQGIVECNLRWLFPTVPGRRKVFDTFCALSLTYRSGGFVTMLAPLRDHFYPQQPLSSPLLCKIKRRYFSRLLADACPDDPGFEEAQWIASEDLNVEHLLDVFITIDPNSDGIWGACAKFMENLCWHKPRLVVLGPKIEDLPDYHSSKPECVFQLSKLFLRVGNYSESKRLYINALELWRELGGDHDVACGLLSLADVNLHLGCIKEAINQAKEALEISERINDRMKQRNAWHVLAELLYEDNQLDAAEEAAFQELDLALEEDNQSLCCYPYTILGQIQYAKGDTEEAVDTFKKALGTALSSWHDEQFWIHFYLAKLFSEQHRFDDAHTHVKHAKSHTANVMFNLGTSMELQAIVWYHEHKFEEAKSEALCAADLFERLGATEKLEDCRELLQDIEEEVEKPIPICK